MYSTIVDELPEYSVQLEYIVVVEGCYTLRGEFCTCKDCMDLFAKAVHKHANHIILVQFQKFSNKVY